MVKRCARKCTKKSNSSFGSGIPNPSLGSTHKFGGTTHQASVSSYTDRYLRVRKRGMGPLSRFVTDEYLWGVNRNYYVVSGIWGNANDTLTPDVINPRIKFLPEVSMVPLDKIVYLLRKTDMITAKYLLANTKKLSSFLESIVGYVQTFSKDVYLVTKITFTRARNKIWSLDKCLGVYTGVFDHLNVSELSGAQKHAIFDKLVDQIHKLYSRGFNISKIKASNVLVTDSNVLLNDPRILSTNVLLKNSSSTGFEKIVSDILDLLFGNRNEFTTKLHFNYHIAAELLRK